MKTVYRKCKYKARQGKQRELAQLDACSGRYTLLLGGPYLGN